MSESGDRISQPDLTAGPERTAGPDKRSEYRLSGRAGVVLELEAVDPETEGQAQPRTLTAQTHDLSATGMRVMTAEALTPGAILPAQVQLAGNEVRYQLIVDVVWCEHRRDGQYAVGLKVLDSDGSSFMDWMEAVARAMIQD